MTHASRFSLLEQLVHMPIEAQTNSKDGSRNGPDSISFYHGYNNPLDKVWCFRLWSRNRCHMLCGFSLLEQLAHMPIEAQTNSKDGSRNGPDSISFYHEYNNPLDKVWRFRLWSRNRCHMLCGFSLLEQLAHMPIEAQTNSKDGYRNGPDSISFYHEYNNPLDKVWRFRLWSPQRTVPVTAQIQYLSIMNIIIH